MKIYDETESISQGYAFAAIDSDKAYIQKKQKRIQSYICNRK